MRLLVLLALAVLVPFARLSWFGLSLLRAPPLRRQLHSFVYARPDAGR